MKAKHGSSGFMRVFTWGCAVNQIGGKSGGRNVVSYLLGYNVGTGVKVGVGSLLKPGRAYTVCAKPLDGNYCKNCLARSDG